MNKIHDVRQDLTRILRTLTQKKELAHNKELSLKQHVEKEKRKLSQYIQREKEKIKKLNSDFRLLMGELSILTKAQTEKSFISKEKEKEL